MERCKRAKALAVLTQEIGRCSLKPELHSHDSQLLYSIEQGLIDSEHMKFRTIVRRQGP